MNMRIAVAGCGIAGATIAWQLAEQGYGVTIFEQAPRCGPVGAGILLQPSGQAVLQRIGLLDAVRQCSPQINSLRAQHRTGRTLVHLPYSKMSEEMHGLGVLRSQLFQLLFERCQASGVDVCEGHRIVRYNQDSNSVGLSDSDDREVGRFDLLIAADGSASCLRNHSGLTKSVKEYPDAAHWTVGPYSGPQDCLLQLVGRCGRLVGMLPIGNGQCSFFWGLKRSDEATTRSAGVDEWKRQVAAFYPAAQEPIADLRSMDEITFATYRSARMKQVTQGRVAFIGDAAHATSPHLGQGLNLALQDAECLTNALTRNDRYDVAFEAYENSRRSTTQFYSTLTGVLTPFFQTSSRLQQLGRDCSLPLMPHLPYVGRQMALTMAGLKTGWLSDSFRRPTTK